MCYLILACLNWFEWSGRETCLSYLASMQSLMFLPLEGLEEVEKSIRDKGNLSKCVGGVEVHTQSENDLHSVCLSWVWEEKVYQC